MVTKMERGALSTSLLVLFVLFTVQFFVGMAQNLLVTVPMTTFPQNNSAFADALSYIVTGGNFLLTTHFIIDTLIIAVGAVTLALTVHKRNIYKVLSIAGLVSVLSAFVNGLRFVASNFDINGISFGMAAGFLFAFILYFVMALLMYRDIGVQKGKS